MNIKDKLSTHVSSSIYGHVKDIADIACDRKQRIVLVGGAVRDVLLGRSVLDADLMLEAPVQPVIDQLAKNKTISITKHDRFLTYSIQYSPGVKLDIVTAREEEYPQPAQLPVVKASTIEKDLRRRDFTINAMACWLASDQEGTLLDPFFGREDLTGRTIRALHSKSFVDDPTRIYRAARFAGRLGFLVASDTEEWIRASIQAGTPKLLSPVRRRHEFELLLKEANPAQALELLNIWGALPMIHPEWADCPDSLLTIMSRRPPERSPVPLLTWRMAVWFKSWGGDKALQMMTDLAFEKDVKRDVMALL